MDITQYQRIYNVVNRSGKPDTSRGFTGWQANAQTIRGAVLEAKKQRDNDVKELADIYNEAETARRRAFIDDEYLGIVKLAKQKLTDSLDAVVAEKRKQYHDIALTPPSADTLRLLQTLALRDDVTAEEVTTIAEDLGDNLQSMKALGAIARKAGIDFPSIPTTEKITDDLDRAEKFSRDQIDKLTTDHAELGYHDLCFWEYQGKGYPAAVYGIVDKPLYTAVQSKADQTGTDQGHQVDAAEITPPKPINYTCSGVETFAMLAGMFATSVEAIKQENPHIHDGRDVQRGTVLQVTPGAGYHPQDAKTEQGA